MYIMLLGVISLRECEMKYKVAERGEHLTVQNFIAHFSPFSPHFYNSAFNFANEKY